MGGGEKRKEKKNSCLCSTVDLVSPRLIVLAVAIVNAYVTGGDSGGKLPLSHTARKSVMAGTPIFNRLALHLLSGR